MDIKNQIKNTLIEVLKLKPREIKEDGKLYDDMGIDSTEIVELLTALEKIFSIELTPQEINKTSTVNEIEKVIKSKLGR